MQLSPTVRLIIGALTVAVSALSGTLAALDTIPDWLGITLAVLTPTLNFLLAPPQLGGTQQGVVNPTLSEPPKADVDPAPTTYAPGGNVAGFWPVAALTFAARDADVNEDEALFWLGVLLVVGFLVAAGVAAFRYANYIAAGVLAVLAVLSAVLLL